MKPAINYLQSFYSTIKLHVQRITLYGSLVLISIVGIWYTYNHAVDFSSIPITFLYLLIYFAFFEIFDSKILKSINTIEELKNGNIAIAIFYLAITVLILAVAVVIG